MSSYTDKGTGHHEKPMFTLIIKTIKCSMLLVYRVGAFLGSEVNKFVVPWELSRANSKEKYIYTGAHDPEPPSSILALGVNPVPLLVIFRTPRGS